VKKVLANAVIYGQAFNTSARPLTTQLGIIAPRGATLASTSAPAVQ